MNQEKQEGVVMTTNYLVTDEQLGRLARKEWELFRRVKEGTLHPEMVLDGLQDLIENNSSGPVIQNPYLHRISSEPIVLPQTDGARTFSMEFLGFLKKRFKGLGLDVASDPTPPTEAAVFEQAEDSTFEKIINGFNVNLDRLCLTPHQALDFDERESTKYLGEDGRACFWFLVKRKSDKVLLAAAVPRDRFCNHLPYIYPLAELLSCNIVQSAKVNRFVVSLLR